MAYRFWTQLLEKHLGRARDALGRRAAATAEEVGRSMPFELAVGDAGQAWTDPAI
jgi:hypothetical protein